MNNLKQISGNDLSELQALTYQMTVLIDKFSHVNSALPKSITKGLEDFKTKLYKERELREDL
jgi:hypothetical protein